MATLTTSPALVVPAKRVQVTFALQETGANFVRVWCTVAPDGSKLAADLKATAATSPREQVYEGDGSDKHPWEYTFDKGGRYTFKAQEYSRAADFTGAYEGDPRGAPTEGKLGTEYTLTLDVGKRFTQTLGVAPDTATLAFWVFGDYIRATSQVHGEVTPVIEKPSTPKAKTAAQTATVTTAAAALAPELSGGSPITTSAALGTVATIVDNLITTIRGHYANGISHNAGDNDNIPVPELGASPTPESLSLVAQTLLRSIRQHVMNDGGSGPASAAFPYHKVGGTNKGDPINRPLVQGVSGVEGSYAALAEIWRCYEAHRVSSGVHSTNDTTNTLTANTWGSVLLGVHRYFFAALASTSPTASPGDSDGAALLKNWGFKEG